MAQAQKDKADLKKRLDLLELQGQGGGRRTQAAAVAGFSTWIVLLVAVIAFLLGKYSFAARAHSAAHRWPCDCCVPQPAPCWVSHTVLPLR